MVAGDVVGLRVAVDRADGDERRVHRAYDAPDRLVVHPVAGDPAAVDDVLVARDGVAAGVADDDPVAAWLGARARVPAPTAAPATVAAMSLVPIMVFLSEWE